MFDLPTPPPPLNGFIVRGHLNQSHRFAIFPCSLDNLVGQLTTQTQKQRMNIKAKHKTFCSYDRNMFIILRIWAITVVAVFSGPRGTFCWLLGVFGKKTKLLIALYPKRRFLL